MKLGEKIKSIRIDNQLTQEEFANKINISRTAVSKWELGKGYPSITLLKTISKEFGVSLDDLLTSRELLSLTENDIKRNNNITSSLVDIVSILAIFLPLFGEKVGDKIVQTSLINTTDISFVRTFTLVFFVLIFIIGILFMISNLRENKKFSNNVNVVSLIAHFLLLCFSILTRQVYASIFILMVFSIKIFLYLKSNYKRRD